MDVDLDDVVNEADSAAFQKFLNEIVTIVRSGMLRFFSFCQQTMNFQYIIKHEKFRKHKTSITNCRKKRSNHLN